MYIYIHIYIYIHTHLLYPPAGNHNIWFIPGRSSHSPRVRRPAALAAEGRTGALRLAGIRQPFFWDVDVEMEKRWENPRKMDPAMDVSENWIYPMIAYDRPFNGKLIKLMINQLMKLDTIFLDKPNFFHGFPHIVLEVSEEQSQEIPTNVLILLIVWRNPHVFVFGANATNHWM